MDEFLENFRTAFDPPPHFEFEETTWAVGLIFLFQQDKCKNFLCDNATLLPIYCGPELHGFDDRKNVPFLFRREHAFFYHKCSWNTEPW